MPFLNFMEDVVSTLVDEIIGNDEGFFKNYDAYRDDVIVYVLNRVPPRYYTSERGILHGTLDVRYLIQEKVDLFYLIHDALDVVRSRRKSELTIDTQSREKNEIKMPHIIGEVLEQTTLLPIPGMAVTLEYDNKKAQMIKDDWKNPFITNTNTKGHYHFWPYLDSDEIEGKKTIPFVLRFNHEKCIESSTEIDVEVSADYSLVKSFRVPIVLVRAKEGSVDFIG